MLYRYLTFILVFVWILSPSVVAKAASPVMSSLATQEKIVALTFDDGPNTYEPDILRILQDNHIHATFFWIGQQANEKQAEQIKDQGSSIQDHSFDHAYFNGRSYESILSNISRAQSSITKATGIKPVYFRPPYGYINSDIQKAADELGLQMVIWNVDSRDWANPNNPDAIKQNVYSEVRPGSVILFHEKAVTVKILPEIIQHLREQGYTFAMLPGLEKKKLQAVPIVVNGKPLTDQGVLVDDVSMVPVRTVFEAMGARVIWHDDQSIDLQTNDKSIHFRIGETAFTIKQETTITNTLPKVPYLDNNLTYVPIRALAEAFGAKITWDHEQVLINTPSK